MRKLIISPDAADGINAIVGYIEDMSPTRAANYYWELRGSLMGLLTLPASFPLADGQKDLGLHKKVFQGLTIVLYRFDDGAVYIESVHDARSNWQDS